MGLGEYGEYTVARETNLGYMIQNAEGEFFLHHNECAGKKFHPGDRLTAFLYADKKRRIAATCFKPLITLNKAAVCDVVARTKDGAFVYCGLSKDLLLSSDDLPEKLMPVAGDKVFCRMRSKNNSLYAKLLTKDAMLPLQDGTLLKVKDTVSGYVYRVTAAGINFFDSHFNIIFVYKGELDHQYRIGEKITARILTKSTDFANEYTGTTIADISQVLAANEEKILTYLQDHFGIMPYTDQSSPAEIEKVFAISKVAFKKALGGLYKKGKIVIEAKRVFISDLKSWSNTIKK